MKRCLEIYSQEDGTQFGWQNVEGTSAAPTLADYTHNGKFCKSGLAYQSANNQATCVSASSITQASETLAEPYKCDPIDPDIMCNINFDIHVAVKTFTAVGKRAFVETSCKCAMTDQLEGFCGSVIGTDFFRKAVRAKKHVLDNS